MSCFVVFIEEVFTHYDVLPDKALVSNLKGDNMDNLLCKSDSNKLESNRRPLASYKGTSMDPFAKSAGLGGLYDQTSGGISQNVKHNINFRVKVKSRVY